MSRRCGGFNNEHKGRRGRLLHRHIDFIPDQSDFQPRTENAAHPLRGTLNINVWNCSRKLRYRRSADRSWRSANAMLSRSFAGNCDSVPEGARTFAEVCRGFFSFRIFSEWTLVAWSVKLKFTCLKNIFKKDISRNSIKRYRSMDKKWFSTQFHFSLFKIINNFPFIEP